MSILVGAHGIMRLSKEVCKECHRDRNRNPECFDRDWEETFELNWDDEMVFCYYGGQGIADFISIDVNPRNACKYTVSC